MRFLSLIRIDETTARPPSDQLLADMGRLMEQMTREGVLIQTAGLQPSAQGARLRLRGGRIAATDGPFAESKEVIGGWAILQADSKEEVMRIGAEFMELHRKHWPEFEGESEIRPIETGAPGSE